MTQKEKFTKLVKAVEMLCDVVYDLSSDMDEWAGARPESVKTLGRAAVLIEELTNEE